MSKEIAEKLVESLVKNDFVTIRDLLHNDVVFTAASPEETWNGAGIEAALKEIRSFFSVDEVLSKTVSLDYFDLPHRSRMSYILEGEEESYGTFQYEHQAYFQVTNGQISHLRMLCSGFFKP